MSENTEQAPSGIGQRRIEELSASIVSAYVSNNAVPAAELPGLIKVVRGALTSVLAGVAVLGGEGPVSKLAPAEIKKSITKDGLVSFIDGRTYQTLKRHLTKHGLSADQYKARFGLPADYPMTSPTYSARRSQLAKDIGLGVPARRAAA